MGSTAKGFAIGFGIFGGVVVLIGLHIAFYHFFDYHTARFMTRTLRIVAALVVVAGYLIHRRLTGKAE